MSKANFGRRLSAASAPLPVMKKIVRPAKNPPPPGIAAPEMPSLDDELKVWKQSRPSSFPLKLLALTASLCFGIASVALPETVNQGVQYPLYALSAASLYAGLRRKRVKAGNAPP